MRANFRVGGCFGEIVQRIQVQVMSLVAESEHSQFSLQFGKFFLRCFDRLLQIVQLCR